MEEEKTVGDSREGIEVDQSVHLVNPQDAQCKQPETRAAPHPWRGNYFGVPENPDITEL